MCPCTTLECVLLEIWLRRPRNKRTSSSKDAPTVGRRAPTLERSDYADHVTSLMMGYEPWAYPPLGKTFLPNLESQLLDLSMAQDDAQAAHKVAQQMMKEQISSKFMPWKVRDKVWLKTTNLHMNGLKKLQMKCTSPFEVEEVISHMAFCL